MENPAVTDEEREKDLLEDIKDIVDAFSGLYDMAYVAYLPLVEDICSRDASEHEVEHLFDYLLDFAREDRMLALYKRVCRRYFRQYPSMIADHVYMWRDMYDEDYEEQL